MNTDRPAYTTEELLAACEEATNVRFHVHQLDNWVDKGLLPSSKRGPGLGRGRGGSEPRRWDAECLPRLILIAKSRTGKYVNVHRAARALVEGGYNPGLKHLRSVLSDHLFEVNGYLTQPLKQNRRFLDRRELGDAEKRQRLHRSDQRRYRDLDPHLRAATEELKAVILGLTAGQSRNPLSHVWALFSYREVSDTLQAASDEQVVEAFEGTGVVLPTLVPVLITANAHLCTAIESIALTLRPENRASVVEAVAVLRGLFVSANSAILVNGLRLLATLLLLHMRRLAVLRGAELFNLLHAALHQSLALLNPHLDPAGVAELSNTLLLSPDVSALESASSHTEPSESPSTEIPGNVGDHNEGEAIREDSA